jgi:hypothetical protein
MSPIYYEWYMINGGYSAPTAAVPANFNIPWVKVTTNSPTSITITFGPSTTTPGSYGGAIVSTGSYNDPDFVINTNSASYSRNDLNPGQKYSFRVRAYSGAGATGTYGEYIYESFTMPKAANVGGVTSSTTSTTTPDTNTSTGGSLDAMNTARLAKILADAKAAAEANAAGDINLGNSTGEVVLSSEPKGSSYAAYGNREVQRSYFKVNNKYKDRSKYALEIKNTGISTSYKKYSFGAGILFTSSLDTPMSGGGIGFFTDSVGSNGYFVELQTDASNKDLKDKSLKIYKVVGNKRVYLQDSQDTDSGRLYGGVLSSTLYKLDIDVVITDATTVITVYVNNFKIVAADTNTAGDVSPLRKTISPTANIALFSVLEKVNFDYVYANPVSATQVTDAASRGLYSGQYANSTLDFTFGEKIAQNFNSPAGKVAYLEEFGTVAREIRYVKANFNQPAAIPLYASTGTNKFATILGSRFSNHSAEIFVINNASSFIPLQAAENKFFVLGNYVDITAQHEYTETTTSDYTTLEPATFQSTWIQSEADAKSLFNWIKLQWSKQQQSINMEIFGNPAIEVGDIVTVNYPKNDLNGTQKFLVTNVNSNFDGGLSTSITARSIYSQ